MHDASVYFSWGQISACAARRSKPQLRKSPVFGVRNLRNFTPLRGPIARAARFWPRTAVVLTTISHFATRNAPRPRCHNSPPNRNAPESVCSPHPAPVLSGARKGNFKKIMILRLFRAEPCLVTRIAPWCKSAPMGLPGLAVALRGGGCTGGGRGGGGSPAGPPGEPGYGRGIRFYSAQPANTSLLYKKKKGGKLVVVVGGVLRPAA